MIILRPLCPMCQTRTVLARVTPGPVGFDIRTFECPACQHVHSLAELLMDPMKSPQNERMASRTTASADVRVRHREWFAEV